MSEDLLKWIVLAGLGLAIWFIQRNITKTEDTQERLKDSIQETRFMFDKALSRVRDEVQDVRNSYLHKDDFKDFKLELRMMFEEIRKDIKAIKNKEDSGS